MQPVADAAAAETGNKLADGLYKYLYEEYGTKEKLWLHKYMKKSHTKLQPKMLKISGLRRKMRISWKSAQQKSKTDQKNHSNQNLIGSVHPNQQINNNPRL